MLPKKDDERFQELLGDGFSFSCHPGVPCFNECCRRLELVLTPYDLLRLKNHLGMTSGEFIDAYTEVENWQNGWPQPKLAMTRSQEETCPFVTPQGCSVYSHRPGACRTYPLGRAARGGKAGGPSEESFFLVREEHCQGFAKGPRWTPPTWTQDQDLFEYVLWNDRFLPLISRQAPDGNSRSIVQKMRMFFMAAYNLEAFKEFVSGSSLARLFLIPPERLRALEEDELELLAFAFDWLAFAIFQDPTLELRPEVAAAQEEALKEPGGY